MPCHFSCYPPPDLASRERKRPVNLCLSIGMILIILAAGIDLSVGAILALSGAVAAELLKNGLILSPLAVRLQFTAFGAIITGLLVGAAAGLFSASSGGWRTWLIATKGPIGPRDWKLKHGSYAWHWPYR